MPNVGDPRRRLRRALSTAEVIAGGPQTYTSRSVMSGTGARRLSGSNGVAPSPVSRQAGKVGRSVRSPSVVAAFGCASRSDRGGGATVADYTVKAGAGCSTSFDRFRAGF